MVIFVTVYSDHRGDYVVVGRRSLVLIPFGMYVDVLGVSVLCNNEDLVSA
jgi:hypothetical protein